MTADNDSRFAVARTALFNLFADHTVPPRELHIQLQLLAELVRMQIAVLEKLDDEDRSA